MRYGLLLLCGLLAGCAAKAPPTPAAEERPVTFPAGKETARGELFRSAAAPSPAVIVVHNDSGITPAIRANYRRAMELERSFFAANL